jgi:hypothetical protein
MAVKPKDETGRDWNWAGGDNAAIHNQFEENRLSARTPGDNVPSTGKFGADAVLISHSAEFQSVLPCFGALAEAGGDLDISTGDFCIAGWLFLGYGMGGSSNPGQVNFLLWGYSRYGIQYGTRYINGRFGSTEGGAYFGGVWGDTNGVVFDTALLTDGLQTTYSLVNGVWVPVTYDASPVEGTNYYVELIAPVLNAEWDNDWHFVAFTRSGNEIAVYFGGQKRAYYNYAGALSCCNGTQNKLYIGYGFVPT